MPDAAPEDPRPVAAAVTPEAVGPPKAGAGASGAPAGRSPWGFVVITGLLLVAGWFLVNWMAETTRLQDCVMAGRRNCAPMDPALGR